MYWYLPLSQTRLAQLLLWSERVAQLRNGLDCLAVARYVQKSGSHIHRGSQIEGGLFLGISCMRDADD